MQIVVNYSQLNQVSNFCFFCFLDLRHLLRCSFFVLIIMQAFQVLSEYLQLLDSLSELSAIQEMSRGVEVNFE